MLCHRIELNLSEICSCGIQYHAFCMACKGLPKSTVRMVSLFFGLDHSIPSKSVSKRPLASILYDTYTAQSLKCMWNAMAAASFSLHRWRHWRAVEIVIQRYMAEFKITSNNSSSMSEVGFCHCRKSRMESTRE
mmetsp:Transcript_4247/g.11571  ORF Transcript_4247/g.11571 Transcript_4247/m.11571 type:complete len:134 (-) Transcript_4247:791-1192(-)